jgi:hypothetical protein
MPPAADGGDAPRQHRAPRVDHGDRPRHTGKPAPGRPLPPKR